MEKQQKRNKNRRGKRGNRVPKRTTYAIQDMLPEEVVTKLEAIKKAVQRNEKHKNSR
ncbi:hypothetical protein [Niallia sp. Krafla_26]|uniref:hypothetical protein n=1 Tax=Niallia sp. Krafla_26 TaxID=3064703 RepID=UPI003D16840D